MQIQYICKQYNAKLLIHFIRLILIFVVFDSLIKPRNKAHKDGVSKPRSQISTKILVSTNPRHLTQTKVNEATVYRHCNISLKSLKLYLQISILYPIFVLHSLSSCEKFHLGYQLRCYLLVSRHYFKIKLSIDLGFYNKFQTGKIQSISELRNTTFVIFELSF